MMTGARLSENEITSLRELIGQWIISVYSPHLVVYETAVRATSASIRVVDSKRFINIESEDIDTGFSVHGPYLFSRPSFTESHSPIDIRYDPAKDLIGPCSSLQFEKRFVVDSVDIFEGESIMHHGNIGATETITQDKQITFTAEDSSLSVIAEDNYLWFFRDKSLAADRATGVRSRLHFK